MRKMLEFFKGLRCVLAAVYCVPFHFCMAFGEIGPATLVKDINQVHLGAYSSDPSRYASFGQYAIMQNQYYYDGSPGEQWITDGTTSGTRFLTSFRIASNVCTTGGIGYFFNNWNELVRTDGTTEGTYKVPGVQDVRAICSWRDKVYFIQRGTTSSQLGSVDSSGMISTIYSPILSYLSPLIATEHGLAFDNEVGLYVSDGTELGTTFSADLNYAGSFVQVNSETYFTATEPESDNIYYLYRTSGLPGDVTRVVDSPADVRFMVAHGKYLYWVRYDSGVFRLLRTDSESRLTQTVEVFPAQAAVEGMVSTPNYVYLRVGDRIVVTSGEPGTAIWGFTFTHPPDILERAAPFLGTAGDIALLAYRTPESGRELWRSDGTSEGTYLLKDINPGPATGLIPLPAAGVPKPPTWMSYNGGLIFTADSPDYGREPWVTDGTPDGTHLLRDVDARVAPGNGISTLSAVGTSIVFSASEDTIYSSNPESPIPSAGTNSNESLWISDGTDAGTTQIHEGLKPGRLTGLGNKYLFAGRTVASGTELWSLDTNTLETTMVVDAAPGPESSEPYGFTTFADRLFYVTSRWVTNCVFSACVDFNVFELNSTDGSPTNTQNILREYFPTYAGYYAPNVLSAAGSKLFYLLDHKLYVTDGSQAGINKLLDGPFNELCNLHSYVIASAGYIYPTSSYCGITVSDGTASGTRELVPRTHINGYDLAATGKYVYFTGYSGYDYALWRTDGTDGGTNPITTVTGQIVPVGSRVFIVPYDSIANNQLWTADDYHSTATLVKNVNSAATESGISEIAALPDGRIIFSADDGVSGAEPWISDGTAAGTYMLQDINPGPESSFPKEFTVAGGRIYFVATTDIVKGGTGRELWSLPFQFNSGKLVALPGTVSFGTLMPDEQSERTLQLRNAGDAPLTISQFTFDTSDYTMINQPQTPATLAPGDSLNLAIRYTATVGMTGVGALVVHTDVPLQSDFDVPLDGRVRLPHLRISDDSITFSQLTQDSQDKQITFFNDGDGTLRISQLELQNEDTTGTFEILGQPSLPLAIAPHSSANIAVRFTIKADGHKTASLHIASNSAEAAERNVLLDGTGYCSASMFTTPASCYDLRPEFTGKLRVKQARNGTVALHGSILVRQGVSAADGSTSAVPATDASLYLLDTATAPCRLPASGVATIQIPPGKLSRPGRPARRVKVNFSIPLSESAKGKYALLVLDRRNTILERDKLNNFVVSGEIW